MVIVFALLALAVLVTANWYLWRRLFRDTTDGPGRARRVGAVLIGGGWVLAVGALVAERTGAPFWLQRVLAWPGFLWLALSIYLLLAVVAGEVVRPLLRRFLERRDGRGEPAVAAVPHLEGYRREHPPRSRRRPEARSGNPGRTDRRPRSRRNPAAPPSSPPPPAASSSPGSSPEPQRRPPWEPSATAPTASCAGPGSSGSPCRWRSSRARRTATGSRWSATST